MKTLLLLMGVWLMNAANAQITPPFLVKAGEYVDQVIPFRDRYRYPTFRNGNVVYTDGHPPAVPINYNYLLGEMQFINPNGDTANLNHEYTLRYIAVGQDLFYYKHKKGFYEIIAQYPSVRLGLQQRLNVVRTETIMNNGYIDTKELTTAAEAARLPLLKARNDTYLAQDRDYFLIDRNDRVLPAHRASFMKLFARHKKGVSVYLKQNAINFRREEDLKKLLDYCSNLVVQ